MTRFSYPGRVASQGVAYGTVRLERPTRQAPARPASTVTGAIALTLMQLQQLQATADQLGSEILQFQVELLEDDHFVAEMLEHAMKTGSPRAAIDSVLGAQIASFTASGSELFAARAADVEDLRARLLGALDGAAGQADDWPEDTILLADDMLPSRFMELDWKRLKGLALRGGSSASHVALLARAQGVPMLVNIGELDSSCAGKPALLDAVSGRLIVRPEPAEISQIAHAPHGRLIVQDEEGLGPALLPDGERVTINLAVNTLASLEETPREWFDGIGLVRTELLLTDPRELLSEEIQTATYRRLFDWADDRPVTIRLFDAGGDKVIPGFSLPHENNAFLGVRGARLLARRPDVLRSQYAAILMAAAGRPVRITVPMLTLPREMGFFRTTLEQVADERGVDRATIRLGMMVETPAAALKVGEFGADFFAIGTNDLIQYTLAATRDSEALDFGDEIAGAVLDLVALVLEQARASGADVTLCGDAAASPAQLRQIIECGIRSVAIPGRFAPRFKHFVRTGE